jgi:O-antigen/teichoic acid export membrane protein
VRRALPALAAYALKAANALAAFAATALLARAAGPAVVGDYGFSVLTGTLLGLLALRGLDQIALRQIAGDLRLEDRAAARGVLAHVSRAVGLTAALVTLAFLLAAAAGPLARLLEVDRAALIAGSLGIGSAALFRLGLGVVRSLGHPVAGQFYEGLNSFIFAALVAAAWALGHVPSAATAVIAFFCCQIVSALLAWRLVRRSSRAWPAATPPDTAALHKAGLPIMAVQGTHMFSDWLLLALIAGAASVAEVGAMRVAMQIVMIISIMVSTGETFLAARVAADIRDARPDLVWARHRRATLAMAGLTGPLVLVCIAVPGPLLTLAFGPGFAIAGPALAIMALGQATKILTGPIGGLLAMAGLERRLFQITLTGLVLLVATALALIPLWGLTGAATAHALTIGFRNIASYAVARRHIRA